MLLWHWSDSFMGRERIIHGVIIGIMNRIINFVNK